MAATAKPVVTDQREIDDLAAALQIQPIELDVDWMNILIYGDPGSGKTFLTGTAEDHDETSPLFLLDVEGGLMTLRKRKGLRRKAIRSMSELEDIYAKLYGAIKQDPSTGKSYIPGINCIGIDSLTELTDLDMRIIMRDAYNRNPDKVDIDVPSQREWGKARSHMRKIVRAFRDLPCHVIYTASVATEQGEGQPIKYFPGFAGKLRTDIPGFMDIVGFMQTKVEPGSGVITRTLQTQGTNRVVAKDRTQSLPGILENPSVPLMWEYITGSKTAEA